MFKFNKHHIEKPKHEPETINFLIFDDIIGTNNGAFGKSASALQNLIIKNRHHLLMSF
jgi:hypothetical protein